MSVPALSGRFPNDDLESISQFAFVFLETKILTLIQFYSSFGGAVSTAHRKLFVNAFKFVLYFFCTFNLLVQIPLSDVFPFFKNIEPH